MTTFNQLSKKKRPVRSYKDRHIALNLCPQKRGQVVRVLTASPKKPSSGRRKVARVVLSNGKRVGCNIPGEGSHGLQKYSSVLIRGCRVRDIPAIKYRAIRGKYDLKFVYERITSRSKYGKKKLYK